MVNFHGRHRVKYHFLKYKVMPRLAALVECFMLPPMPA